MGTKKFKTLISTDELASHLDDPDWVILDCRYSLANPSEGEDEYILAHIPGAVYLHLDRDLSAVVVKGVTGRHPLPEPTQAVNSFASSGIGNGTQVAVYDAADGSSAATRAWWMLRWLGHEAVAVVDGGWQKWLKEDRPVRSGREANLPATLHMSLQSGLTVTADEVQSAAALRSCYVFDSRSAERFRGENETIDPVAGRIPGATSAPYTENNNPDGTFKAAESLRMRFSALFDGRPETGAIFYCGSGSTACHNILAWEIAGLGPARLYPGSWSEWITDPERPVARG
jgi:thiosulfate/3-mercaptopyruvate sulfurtransferase